MARKWSQSDEKGLAFHVPPELPDCFSLPEHINRLELLQWKQYRELAGAVYDALEVKNIKYALEPDNSEPNIQLIRTPEEILETRKEGTCLDLAVLYCGLCLGVGLLPLLIVLRKHALVAVSLHYSSQEYWEADSDRERERILFQKEPLKNMDSLRNLVDGERFIFIECTGFAHIETVLSKSTPEGDQRQDDGSLTFERAIAAGAEQLHYCDRPLEFAIDAAIAHRYWKIKQDVVYSNPRMSQSSPLGKFEQLMESGYQHLKNNQFSQAEEIFDSLRKLHPKRPEPWLGKANIAFKQGNTDIALQFVDKSLSRLPTYWQALAFKIKLLLLLGGIHRDEARQLADEYRGTSLKLDAWLDCLTDNKVFTRLVATDSMLNSLCPIPQ